jgi:tetratricopeptide (TPR) repeat protein
VTRLFAAAAIAASLLARPGGQDEALRKLADRCGTEIEWQSRWDDAARKARQEGRTILVQICRNAHFIESDDSSARWLVLRSGLYSDPDLIRLLRSRFVCLRVLGKDDLRGLPFKAELEGHTLSGDGTAQVIATPDGRVLSEICTFDASRLLTAAAGACEGPRRTPLQDPMDEAEALLDRCEIAAALELSKSVKTFRAHRLRAAAYRRLRKGDEALAALASARAVAPAESQSDLDLEEGVLLLRLGRTDDAETLFRRVRGESRAEARFWAGACRFAKADPAGAAADWGLVATEHGDSRWAWKAAANLLGLGAIVHEVERLRWPPDPIPTSRPVPRADPDDSADLEKGAIEFLAATQRDDGSWPSPEEATLAALGYSEAVTAICAHALLPHRKQPEVERMLRRALAFLDRSLREGRLFAESCPAYNGRLWAHAFLIPLLVDLGDRGLSRHLPELVAAVRKSQQPSGAWDYAFRLSDIAVSFSTACTVLALQDARRAGIDVPEATLRRAVTLLRDMRTSQGWFPYW